jgi:uncharacterized protein YlzI (FlbEa/FlbD family)
MPLKRSFVQITESVHGGDAVTYINIQQIESVAVRVDNMVQIKMVSGRIYLVNEPIHTLLERIQCE